MTATQEEIHEQLFRVGAKVFQRATTDPAFRALALKDGTAAVEEVVGKPLPDGVKIRFVENNGASATIGLPPARTSGELSDRELEAVAGGRDSPSGSDVAEGVVEGIGEGALEALARE